MVVHRLGDTRRARQGPEMRRRMSLLQFLLAAVVAVPLVFAPCVSAQTPPPEPPPIRLLDAMTGGEKDVPYRIVPGTDLVLPFTVVRGGKLELLVSPFRGEHGETVLVEPSLENTWSAAGRSHLVFTAADGEVLHLRLSVPTLSQPGKYTGTISVLRDGRHQHTSRLAFVRATTQRPAALVADWKNLTVHKQTKSLRTKPVTFSMRVRNASADWPANGIFLRLLDVTAPAGRNFDPVRNLALTWNDENVGDLWRSPKDGNVRSLPPNQQAVIAGRLGELAPGEYTIKVGLAAANAPTSDEHPVTLTLFVRHGLALPALVLLSAILLSFLATKGLETQRRRAATLRKINQVRQGFADRDRYSMPAIAARAFLAQAQAQNASWWVSLFGQDSSSTLVKKAELLCRILLRADDLRKNLESQGWSTMMRHRARKRLTAITSSLNPMTLDDTQAAKVEGELTELEKWLDPAQANMLYRVDFQADLQTLMTQALPEVFDGHTKLVESLRQEIQPALEGKPLDAKAVAAFERAYGRLKLLWERKQDGDLATLDTLLKQPPDISLEAFFEAADQEVWKQLQEAQFQFKQPKVNEVVPRHKHELIRFEIEPSGSMGKSFLFKHGLRYDWSLWLNGSQLTQETTSEPRIVQYAPRAGTLSVNVTMLYKNARAKNNAALPALRIGESSDYGFSSLFRLADLGALAVSFVFAMVTGLTTYYFDNQSFGSVSDYVALFVWGAGVDQTKNFVQYLASNRT